jgi:hypothetical protein
MRVNINQKFWNKSNWLAKAFFIIGTFFMDLAMKINGYSEGKNL